MSDNRRNRAADDFVAIGRRIRELAARRRFAISTSTETNPKPAKRIAKNDPAGFDVVCDQPTPEDWGVIDGGADHIRMKRNGS